MSYDITMRVATEDPDKSSGTSVQLVGVSLGGILFDPATAEVYNNDRNSGWNYEALTIGAASNTSLAGAIGYLGTDCNNAHVQPNGKYHYHGMPEELVDQLLEANGNSAVDPEMVMVGYAADGYPMYARYGVTPEYPNGIYHYYVTDDYPFIQRCVWGEPTDDVFLRAP